MSAILINNLRRLWVKKQLIVLLVVFTGVAAVAAIFVSRGLQQTWDVAVVTDRPMAIKADHVNLHLMEQAPSISALILGEYDAIMRIKPDESYELSTIKSEETRARIAAALEGRQETTTQYSGRGTGTNILGFLMMFVLIMGSMAMCMYADDKVQGQIDRVAASPIGMSKYLFAHSLFNFCFLFIPTMIILSAVLQISGTILKFRFWELAGLIAILCVFSTVFCLLLYSLLSNKDESAKMTGNTVIILTSILAGNFYAFDKENPALELMVTVLPQKAFLILADGLEQGSDFITYMPALVYLLILIVTFYTVSVVKTRRVYVNKH